MDTHSGFGLPAVTDSDVNFLCPQKYCLMPICVCYCRLGAAFEMNFVVLTGLTTLFSYP